jgi:hypothetical protein
MTTKLTRQEKIDLITAALEKRGYCFWELSSSTHGWTVRFFHNGGCIEDFYPHFHAHTFEDLLELLDDDLTFAQFVYREKAPYLEKNSYDTQRHRELENYSRFLSKKAIAEWEEDWEGVEYLGERAQQALEAARANHEQFKRAAAELDEYLAEIPDKPEAAVAYLASLPKRPKDGEE